MWGRILCYYIVESSLKNVIFSEIYSELTIF